MFTSCTDDSVKTQIIRSFSSPSHLRIVCATIAFGMDIDCPDVHHFGASDDFESNIQETGRAGQDKKPALALLLNTKRTHKFMDQSILDYMENDTVCYRDFLFGDMDNYKHHDLGVPCLCCDICARSCSFCLCCENHSEFTFIGRFND